MNRRRIRAAFSFLAGGVSAHGVSVAVFVGDRVQLGFQVCGDGVARGGEGRVQLVGAAGAVVVFANC